MTTVVSPKVSDLTQEVDYLRQLFGQTLAAFIAGVDDARLVEGWSRGMPIASAESRRNLHAAYEVAKLLRAELSAETVQAWFMGMNPNLDDLSPIEVIKEDPDLVIRAAQDFLAHG